MFGLIRNAIGAVDVEVTKTHLIIKGMDVHQLYKDVYSEWEGNVLQKHMLASSGRYQMRILNFFAFDFLTICQTLLDRKARVRTPKRTLIRMIELLKTKTWLGDAEREEAKPILTFNPTWNQNIPFTAKPYQKAYIEHYAKMVPAYRLRGYMLDAGVGTGKTATSIVLALASGCDHIVVVGPKNVIGEVFVPTLNDRSKTKIQYSYWSSLDNKAPTLQDKFYLCHYNSLPELLAFIKLNAKQIGSLFIINDESHNLNRVAADRTQTLIELSTLKNVKILSNWQSATPIMALGVECIPFLKCVDPLFTPEAEEAYRKIWGKDAKRANDILRARIGNLKYFIPTQDGYNLGITEHDVKIKLPNGNDYTLATISKQMSDYAMEREKYYQENWRTYQTDYDEGLTEFEKTLHGRTNPDYEKYKRYVKQISAGFDPASMKEESMFCNTFERKVIIPTLPNELKPRFRSAKSVIKYVDLKIMGEVLGTVLGKARTKCIVELTKAADLAGIVDQGLKKTVIFTSFVEAVEAAAQRLHEQNYNAIPIHGASQISISAGVKLGYSDPDANPIVTTFQSLSTGVPLVFANQLILLNQPYRSGVREQTLGRTARLGQDQPVEIYNFFLDTGETPNISTRSNDIMKWSADQVAQILGNRKLNAGEVSLEALEIDMGETLPQDLSLEEEKLPPFLYHGSMYKQDELMPGFQRSGEVSKWDGTEDNTWLYASSSLKEAEILGIASAIEKTFTLDRFSSDIKNKTITIDSGGKVRKEDLYALNVYLYTIIPNAHQKWYHNFNQQNNIKTEYKTQATVTTIASVKVVDVEQVLMGYKVIIK